MLDNKNFNQFDYLVQTVPQLLNSLRNSNNDSSLLMRTARYGKQDAFSKLLEYPQDISIVDIAGENVFHYVSCYRNVEWWLDELKKNVNDDNKLKELLDRKDNYRGGETSLHCAASRNNHQVIKWLLLNGADVNATNKWGELADVCGYGETKKMIREHRDK